MNLKKNLFINFAASNLKTVVNNLESNYGKFHHEWYFSRRH